MNIESPSAPSSITRSPRPKWFNRDCFTRSSIARSTDIEKRFAAQNLSRFVVTFIGRSTRFAFEVKGALRIGNRDLVSPEFVPGIGVDSVSRFVVARVGRPL